MEDGMEDGMGDGMEDGMEDGMIVALGEALIDLVLDADSGPDSVVGAPSVVAALGGAPFNAARAASRMGADVEFVGAFGADRFGAALREQLVADGVGVGFAPVVELPTTLAIAELTGGAAEYRFYLEATSAPALHDSDLASLPGDPAIVVTGALGLVLEPMATSILDYLERVDAIVVVDVNCRPRVITDRPRYVATVDRAVRRADVVKVSDEDLAYLHPEVPTVEAAGRLVAAGAGAVVVTAGAEGTTIVTSAGTSHRPVAPLAAPLVDTIGAGDTFIGAFCARLVELGVTRRELSGDPLERLVPLDDAVDVGHAAAAIVVTRRGADPPHRHEL